MLDRWLEQERRWLASDLLAVRDIQVDTTVGEKDLEEALGKELLRNYLSPKARSNLIDVFAELGLDELADHLQQHTVPQSDIVRIGDFGEALTGVLFRRVRRYCVPVLKLRYKHRPDQAVQGSDLVAFRLSADPPVVASPEVKTRTTKDLRIGIKANESLASGLRSLSSTIQFVGALLSDQGNDSLATRVFRLLSRPIVVERHIVLVHDEDVWDDRIMDHLRDGVTNRTEATVIRIKALRHRIGAAYAAAPSTVVPRTVLKPEGDNHRA
jgi:hypothetical protein